MAYNVMMKGMTTWSAIPATRYETDGSGTRFYDASDALVASFADGHVTAVLPDTVATPAPEGTEEAGET